VGLLRMRTETLHAQAQKCHRLASESLDVFVREALTELASDYEHLAERLKQQRKTSTEKMTEYLIFLSACITAFWPPDFRTGSSTEMHRAEHFSPVFSNENGLPVRVHR
jgi:ferritin-like protein